MNKLICAAVILSSGVLACGLWRRAESGGAQSRPGALDTVQRVTGRIGIDPVPERVDTRPPGSVDAVVFRPKLTASGQVLPGRRVKVVATCDFESKPAALPHDYLWRLEFLRRRQAGAWQEAWAWTYDQTLVSVKPGTHTAREFTENVGMPPDTYLVRVWLVSSHWEDSVDGYQLVADDAEQPGHLMTSFRVEVP